MIPSEIRTSSPSCTCRQGADLMLILEAVNEMLTAMGLSRVTTCASGVPLEASVVLDRWSIKIQSLGWHCNTEGVSQRRYSAGIELAPPDTTIAYTVAPTGSYEAGETLTEATSGATGRFQYINTTAKLIYITQASDSAADFTGGEVLTGSENAYTVTGTDLAAVTEGYIYVDTDILTADPVLPGTSLDLTIRSGRFYDIANDTYTFSDPLNVVQVRKLDFEDLPDELAELISIHALIDFCAKVALMDPPPDAAKRLRGAQMRAAQIDGDRSDLNVHLTHHAYHIAGGRTPHI